MRIFYELTPKYGRTSFIDKLVHSTMDYVDGYDIPESPLAIPTPNSPLTALYIKLRFNVKVIPHIRLYDLNRIALLSIAYGLSNYGVDMLVLTKGDKPKDAIIVNELSTEDAVILLKDKCKDLRLGMILSLKYPMNEIERRLNSLADFFLVLRFSNEYLSKYAEIARMSRSIGKELYVYVIVATKRNINVIKRINQPYIKLEKLEQFLKRYEGVLNNVIASIPGDYESVGEVLKIMSKFR